jgi:hypothetical protein
LSHIKLISSNSRIAQRRDGPSCLVYVSPAFAFGLDGSRQDLGTRDPLESLSDGL